MQDISSVYFTVKNGITIFCDFALGEIVEFMPKFLKN